MPIHDKSYLLTGRCNSTGCNHTGCNITGCNIPWQSLHPVIFTGTWIECESQSKAELKVAQARVELQDMSSWIWGNDDTPQTYQQPTPLSYHRPAVNLPSRIGTRDGLSH